MSDTAIGRGGFKRSSRASLGRPTLLAVAAAFGLLFIAVVGFGPAGFLVFLLVAALAGILAIPRLQRGQLVVFLALFGVLVFSLVTRQRAAREATGLGPSSDSALSGSIDAPGRAAGSAQPASRSSDSRAASSKAPRARLD